MALTWGDVGKFILAFILPPLGVLTETESLNRSFWINVLLTLLGWLPGVIHAFYVILRY
ncbi:Plasma membrane proteolipid 3 [Tetrabaena socialis]|uniref:Plasma membrane proteolipid 3 n=1 Tax=Tetrabaena socialis TaxID=47790 RepID=A0A2J8AIE7_9CHLO|nr:Plasma membrane proteolipid 3 [Tetrabaena socialis]|eukprot:PNH12281.1 Plasma membrane proteolipid 3 [Tetrabaena socialis]